jgi:hypothetical protein
MPTLIARAFLTDDTTMTCNTIQPIPLRLLACAMVLFLCLLASSSAIAATYTFTSLYNNAGPIFAGSGPPSLNDFGVVAFQAYNGSNRVIVKGNGGPMTTIASEGATYSEFSRYPAIGNSGAVMFKAIRTGGLPGIFRGTGGPATNISDPYTGNFTTDLGIPAINSSDQILFMANDGGVKLFVGNGVTTTFVASGGVSASSDINDAGTVGFMTTSLVRRWNSGVTTTVASVNSPYSDFSGSPGINAAGDIVYSGFLSGGSQTAISVYRASTNSNSIVASPATGFTSVGLENAITDAGDPVFRGTSASGTGIYVGANAANGPVIYLGMSLFGSTLSSYEFYRHGANGPGQLAFYYSLTNGGSGIALASPVPEPATILLAVAFVPLFFACRSSRWQRSSRSRAAV